MSGRLQSLIKSGAPAQLDLIPSDQMPARVFESAESDRVPESTAARTFAERPEDYRLAVSLLSEGVPVERIARSLRLGVGTVYAIQRRELPEVEALKKGMAQRAREVAQSALEVAAEALADPARRGKTSARDAAITAGVLIDKAKELDSSAGVVEMLERERQPGHSDLARDLAAFGAGVLTGLRARTEPAKGAPAAGDGGAEGGELACGAPVTEPIDVEFHQVEPDPDATKGVAQ